MKNEPLQKTGDSNTDRVAAKRRQEASEKPVPEPAPLKDQGQPAWREVKKDA